ncbi:hypothetical protein [uncultured Sphingomonas sp.]|uniref:hypothetical protein n=1 Tax=uncultured Sphingomonas sp. TaxID=158754 RepID=UPI0035CC219F
MTNHATLDTFTDTIALATCWLNKPASNDRLACTLLVGAATLVVSRRFGQLAFDLQAHSSTVTDNPAGTIAWLAERLPVEPGRLLLWRAEDIVVPSLLAAAETARDMLAGARLLRSMQHAFADEVVDVAESHGGRQARSFDAVAHRHGLPFIAMTDDQLGDAHRTGCHGAIRDYLAGRAKAIWQLWLQTRADGEAPRVMTEAWLESPEAELRL